MKKLFALLIAAGCLISYNVMAEEKMNNVTEFKSAPQEAVVEKYSNYRAIVPADEELPMMEGMHESNTGVEDTFSEIEEVVAEVEENISEAQEQAVEEVKEAISEAKEEVKENIAETQDKIEGAVEEISAKIALPTEVTE